MDKVELKDVEHGSLKLSLKLIIPTDEQGFNRMKHEHLTKNPAVIGKRSTACYMVYIYIYTYISLSLSLPLSDRSFLSGLLYLVDIVFSLIPIR